MQNSLYEHGQDLIFTLKRNLVPQRPIVFVAHSLGGIIVKDVSHATLKLFALTQLMRV